jgi:hypothetical protein
VFRRLRLVPSLVTSVFILVVAAVIASACGGNPYGSCVTYYTDGDVYRFNTDKAYCEESCAERIASSTNIASCYFEGSRSAPLEP